MLYKISNCLADKLDGAEVITLESKDVYLYGLEVMISSLLSTLLILIIGLALNRFIDTLSFLVVFIGLRSFSGGFHANTYLKCAVVTLSLYFAVILLSFFIKIPQIALWCLAPVGVAVLAVKAPVRNPNKPLTESEAVRHKIVSIIIFLLIVLAGSVLPCKFASAVSTLFFTAIADLGLMFVKTRYIISK